MPSWGRRQGRARGLAVQAAEEWGMAGAGVSPGGAGTQPKQRWARYDGNRGPKDGAMGGGRRSGATGRGRADRAGSCLRPPSHAERTDRTRTPGWAQEPRGRRPGTDRTQVRLGEDPWRGTPEEADAAGRDGGGWPARWRGG